MRQKVFFIVALFAISFTSHANTNHHRNSNYFRPISFLEQGIEFTVFENGTFDFRFQNYNETYSRRDSYNRRGRKVIRDRRGRIRNVGNVFIDYDRFGRLAFIGDVSIQFRNRRLASIGNLNIHYNRFGEIFTTGQVYRPRRVVCGTDVYVTPRTKIYKRPRYHKKHKVIQKRRTNRRF